MMPQGSRAEIGPLGESICPPLARAQEGREMSERRPLRRATARSSRGDPCQDL